MEDPALHDVVPLSAWGSEGRIYIVVKIHHCVCVGKRGQYGE